MAPERQAKPHSRERHKTRPRGEQALAGQGCRLQPESSDDEGSRQVRTQDIEYRADGVCMVGTVRGR